MLTRDEYYASLGSRWEPCARVIVTAAEIGIDDIHLYPDYGGRFMYGERCLGLVGQQTDIMAAVVEALFALNASPSLRREILEGMSIDSMGLDMIYYWPQVRGWLECEEVELLDR